MQSVLFEPTREVLSFSIRICLLLQEQQNAADEEDVCEDHVKTKRCIKWKNKGNVFTAV